MSGPGELVPRPALRGEVLSPGFPPPPRGRGAVFREFAGRLRGYVAPPPPDELGWYAAGGAALMLVSAGLIALLPAGSSLRHAGLFKWVGRSDLASTMDSLARLPEPLALLAIVVMIGVAAIYIARWGSLPALVFLTAQTWLGVAAGAIAVFGWAYLLLMFALNLIAWIAFIALLGVGVIVALAILGLFADS